MVRYFRNHWQSFVGALRRIGNTPTGAMLNVLVVAIALALPTGLQVVIANASQLAPAFEDAADFTVYLDLNVTESDGRALADAIAARADVAATEFIGKEEGLTQFAEWAGFGGALDALSDNPLPHVIQVRPLSDDGSSLDELESALAAMDGTAAVQLDRLWVERLQAILTLARRAINIVTMLLATGVIVIVGNTIRLEINNRRTEIEVLKLVGATDGFIRRPFLYTGLWVGALGAIAATLVVGVGLWLLSRPVRDLAELYPSDFALAGLGLGNAALLVAGGASLGWAGAWIAAARHLKAIEPA